MRFINVALEYRIIVRYAPDVPESELDELVRTIERNRMPKRLLHVTYGVLQRFPGLVVEVYEDQSEAPALSAITKVGIRRTGT
jgi:hypothetical protein